MYFWGATIFTNLWHNVHMYDIFKTTLGFMALIFVGLAGVLVSQVLSLGDTNTIVTTIDNVTNVR